jgi:hypothetical protein
VASERHEEWARQAARRAAALGLAATPEDEIVRALLAGGLADLAHAERIRAGTGLIDHDYLAYWVDELGLQELWRTLG